MQRFLSTLQDPSPRNRRRLRLIAAAVVAVLLVFFIAVLAFQLGRSSGVSTAQRAASTAENIRLSLPILHRLSDTPHKALPERPNVL